MKFSANSNTIDPRRTRDVSSVGKDLIRKGFFYVSKTESGAAGFATAWMPHLKSSLPWEIKHLLYTPCVCQLSVDFNNIIPDPEVFQTLYDEGWDKYEMDKIYEQTVVDDGYEKKAQKILGVHSISIDDIDNAFGDWRDIKSKKYMKLMLALPKKVRAGIYKDYDYFMVWSPMKVDRYTLYLAEDTNVSQHALSGRKKRFFSPKQFSEFVKKTLDVIKEKA